MSDTPENERWESTDAVAGPNPASPLRNLQASIGPQEVAASDSDATKSDATASELTHSDVMEIALTENGAQDHLADESVRLSQAPSESEGTRSSIASPGFLSLVGSTLLSLVVVLVLLVCLRYLLPPMLESSRYSWHRGQLRAEYELAGDQLERVSWDGLAQVSQTVVRRVGPSVVHIQVASQDPEENEVLRRWNPDLRGFRAPAGQGSGIIVDPEGYILTNQHVLEGNANVEVFLADDRVFRAEIVGVDRTTDLALLKIDATDLLPIEWGDSDAMEVGSPVWAVGSPFGLTGSVSFGILSGKHRVDLNANPQYRGSRERITSRYSDLMQSDVAVNPGNSGGPLVNGRGQLVGINTAIVGESYRGVSFAIPSRIAKNVVSEFMAHGRVRRGWIGVELGTELTNEESSDEPRVVIRAVVPDSPAAKAGLYPGDRILRFNDSEVRDVNSLIDTIRTTPADSAVTLEIARDGEMISIRVTLGELSFAP